MIFKLKQTLTLPFTPSFRKGTCRAYIAEILIDIHGKVVLYLKSKSPTNTSSLNLYVRADMLKVVLTKGQVTLTDIRPIEYASATYHRYYDRSIQRAMDCYSSDHMVWNYDHVEFSHDGNRFLLPLCQGKRFLPVGALYLGIKRFYDQYDPNRLPTFNELLYWLSLRGITVPTQFIYMCVEGWMQIAKGTGTRGVARITPVIRHCLFDKDHFLQAAALLSEHDIASPIKSYDDFLPEFKSYDGDSYEC